MSAASSVFHSSRVALGSSEKSRIEQFWDLFHRVCRVVKKTIGFFAMCCNLYYGAQIIHGLASIGVPSFAAFTIVLALQCIFTDYFNMN